MQGHQGRLIVIVQAIAFCKFGHSKLIFCEVVDLWVIRVNDMMVVIVIQRCNGRSRLLIYRWLDGTIHSEVIFTPHTTSTAKTLKPLA